MAKPKREQCPVVYQGNGYPSPHGTRCGIEYHPHPTERHTAFPNGRYLAWLTEEEKAALRG